MTPEQARVFIRQAEQQPIDQVDTDQLRQAIYVLTQALSGGMTGPEGAWVRRGRALAEQAGIINMVGPVPGAETGGTGDTPVDQILTGDQIDRLRTAGRNAGIPEEEIDFLVDQYRNTVENDTTGAAGQLIPQLIEQQIRDWEEEAEALAPSPIGVPQGYEAAREVTFDPSDRPRFAGRATGTVEVEPRYFEGDELNPAGLSADVITRLQNQLIRAGLIDEDEVWMGVWDPASQGAYKTVLGLANQSGTTADAMVDRLIASVPESLKAQRERRREFATFQPEAYLKPDKATLRQRVKAIFRSEVGRDPRPGELTSYVAQLEEDDRAAFDVEEAMRRDAFTRANFQETRLGATAQAALDAFLGAGPTGVPVSSVPVLDPSTAAPSTFQAVDPVARFQEAFESRYKPEMDRLDSLAAIQANHRNIAANMANLATTMRGRP